MIRVIMGKKGTGKTKQMIDMINEAVGSEHGNVVCIEKGNKLIVTSSHKSPNCIIPSVFICATYFSVFVLSKPNTLFFTS